MSTSAEGDAQPEDRPSPPVPPGAVLVGEWGNVELTITADPEGKVTDVKISKPSKVKVFDEHIRSWVEKNWKMPPAEVGQQGDRKFQAPIVFPRGRRPAGGKYPDPPYPAELLLRRVQGSVGVIIDVGRSGAVLSAHVLVSSGCIELDDHTTSWVKKKWRFPAAQNPQQFIWPCHYLMPRGSDSSEYWKTGRTTKTRK